MRISEWSSDVCSSDLFRPGSADWDLPEQGDGGFFNNRADFLVREILDEIRVRHWREGERLGTTRELMDRYDVSLPVLRQALRVLEERGAVSIDRKSVVEGQRVSVRGDAGGRGISKKKKHQKNR